MSNSKKQTVVIAVLILLIACAGWFAKRFNDTQEINALNADSSLAKDSATFYAEGRMGRDNTRSAMKQELEKIINDQASNKEAVVNAQAQLMLLLDRGNKENQIETLVKGRGYEDVLCFIDENGVQLCVKTADALTGEQVNQIKDDIVRTTGIAPSNIVVKQK